MKGGEMDEIMRELEFLKKESLREDWNKLLLDAWTAGGNAPMSNLIVMFKLDHNNNFYDDKMLNDVFNHNSIYKITVRRFIALFLKPISDNLFDGVLSKKEILLKMKNIKISKDTIEYKKLSLDRSKSKSESNFYTSGIMSLIIQSENSKKSRVGRGSWGIVK